MQAPKKMHVYQDCAVRNEFLRIQQAIRNADVRTVEKGRNETSFV
jgi:hypothetical protein